MSLSHSIALPGAQHAGAPDTRPAVSVVMPAYNVEEFVGGAIESVQAQTFKAFELMIVDDGSTDRTAEIVESYARNDGRIILLRQPNRGLSTARNVALQHSRGTYIAILDSDDSWVPSFLEWQVGILEDRPDIDIVTGNAWFLGGPSDGQPAMPTPDARPDPDLRHLLEDETAVFIMSVFRRRVFETIGGFDEGFRSNEDYDFWIRAAAAGFRFVRHDRPAGYYRRRADSLSSDEIRMLSGILRVYEKTRPALLDRPAELSILDAQVRRFETEHVAAEARCALEGGDCAAAKRLIFDLHRRRGGALLRLACMLANRAPRLLSFAYHVRRSTFTP